MSTFLNRLGVAVMLGAVVVAVCVLAMRPRRGVVGEAEPGTKPGNAAERSRAAAPVSAALPDRSSGVDGVTRELPAELEALLADEKHWIRMHEVPRLDTAMEDELVRRYHSTESLADRYRLLRTLAFGGSHKVVPLIARALTHDYAGAPLTETEEAMITHLPCLMGIAAARSDEALQWLLQASEPGFWERIRLWTKLGGDPEWVAVPRGFCIRGLGLSGRREAWDYLAGLREDEDRVIALDLDGALVDAAFSRELVERNGLQAAVDLVGEKRNREFVRWIESNTNGIEWWKWNQSIWRKRTLRSEQTAGAEPK